MYLPHKSDNLTTAFVMGGSLLGMYLARNLKYYNRGFAIALGVTVAADYMHRRELDNVHYYAFTSGYLYL